MKKYYFLIIVALILGLVLTGCTLLSNIGQVPTNEQSGITYLTKGTLVPGNLVGLWHFDSNADDSSGYDNDGTLYNFVSPWVSGMFGQALSFDGVDDYVRVSDSDSLDLTDNFTWELWIKRNSFGTIQDLVSKNGPQTSGAPTLYFATDNRVSFVIQNVVVVGTSVTAITDTKWHHIALSKSGSTYKFYIDGSLNNTVTNSNSPTANNRDLGIGAEPPGTTWPFNGIIDEVRIWNIALTANQIQQSMASPLPVIVTTSRSEPDSVEVNAEQDWNITITVCNYDAFESITGVVVQGGMGADLDGISEVGDASGDVVIAPKTVGQGNQKMRATMVTWTLDLGAGSCEDLVVNATTGFNPKGYHEFTTVEEDHELDGGASATYWYEDREYETPETEPLTVDVVGEED